MGMNKKIRSAFPDILSDLIAISGKPLREIAKESDVGISQLSAYQTGKNEPNMSTLVKLSNYFDVSLDWLVGRPNNTMSEKEQMLNARKYTGLSFDAIKLLRLYKSRYIQLIDIFNDLILDKHFWHSIDCLRYAKYAKTNSDKKMSDELEKLHIEIGIINSFERNPNATTITAEQMVDLNLFLASQDFTECAKRIISLNDGEQEGEDGQH